MNLERVRVKIEGYDGEMLNDKKDGFGKETYYEKSSTNEKGKQ
jgi:hypothetical protein